MDKKKISVKKIVNYWERGAKHDWETAQSLRKSSRNDACLFFCHLVLEKYLKSMVVEKTKQHTSCTHNLVELAQKANLNLNEEQLERLAEINEFNLSCRYPDYKYNFYKKCTKKFTDKYFDITKKLYTWLKKYQNKK